MTAPIIAILSFVLAAVLTFFIMRQQRQQRRADIERLKHDIELAQQRHAPRSHLQKQLIQAVAMELRHE